MKKIFLLIVLFITAVFSISLKAQTCDITSTGLSLLDLTKTASLPYLTIGGQGYARLRIVNFGSNCSYGPGQVRVGVDFPPAGLINHYYKYIGDATFTSNNGKFTFTYNSEFDQLKGTNTVPFATGLLNTEFVDVKIEGVKATPIPSSNVSDLTMELSLFQSAGETNPNNNVHNLRIDVIGPGGGVLPITLNEFDAKAENCTSVLNWKTSNETNLSKYEIESSTDGIVFTAVGTVKPNASNTTGLYQFSWNQKAGKAYYRLKIIDKDASVSYSKIIPVTSNCSDKKLVQLYPNPVNTAQILNVNISGYDKGIKGDLYSATGQFIKSYVLKNGKNDLTVENLSQGFYTLKISENGTQTEVFKLNVIR
jgi:hypothetical protein